MANNKITGIQNLRILDGVIQFINSKTGIWKPMVNSVLNKTTGFTLELSDTGKYIRVNSATGVTITVPNLEFPLGGTITLEQVGEGVITLAAGTGVTLNGDLLSSGQYKVVQIIKVTATSWTVIGGTTA